MSRVVITSCSKSKIPGEGLLPAIDRYDGPGFRLLRKYFRQHQVPVEVFILSAKFGLLSQETKIPFYEQPLHKNFTADLGILAARQAQVLFGGSNDRSDIFINLGKAYFEAFQPTLARFPNNTSVTIAKGSSGRRLSELHDWLYGDKSHLLESVKSGSVEREVRFRGVLINASEADIRVLIRAGITNGEIGLINNYQSWFVCIDELKVSPKWLVSKLSGIPVGTFHSDQARRLLGRLGITVSRV